MYTLCTWKCLPCYNSLDVHNMHTELVWRFTLRASSISRINVRFFIFLIVVHMPECHLDSNWLKQWSVSGCETPFVTLCCFSLCRKCCRRRGKTSQARRWRSTSASLTPAPSWWRSVCCCLGHGTTWNSRHFPCSLHQHFGCYAALNE